MNTGMEIPMDMRGIIIVCVAVDVFLKRLAEIFHSLAGWLLGNVVPAIIKPVLLASLRQSSRMEEVLEVGLSGGG